ncbi:unnamed protein product [Adineta steineri]|uniref:Uncharacterized protein n=1 Tax=Adineta steineri TaxID=433720 RepID=A0A814RSK4_9BILA|nr:unnamed protein product [Adineta steineri]CAF3944036.1 unnamed protein product [Adineta steineri]
MGNRISQNNNKPSLRHSSNKRNDQQYFHRNHHMDSHYTIINQILNQHCNHFNLNTSIEQAAMNIHRNALHLAMEHHKQISNI